MPAPHSSADTPVMRQFLEIKSRYPDAILMFRMGDFYEMFFDDAIEVAPILDIVVTSRDKGTEDPVPMAGVPYHALGGYLRTLIERGLKVAICEQLESPEDARKRKGSKIVRRDVVRVVTPGARVDEEHLQAHEPNFLGAIAADTSMPTTAAIALCDISSGDFLVIEAETAEVARTELQRFAPREILAAERDHEWLRSSLAPNVPRLEAVDRPADAVVAQVQSLAHESGLAGLGSAAERAVALVLEYAQATHPGQALLLHRLRRHVPTEHLVLDDASVRNLELFKTLRDGARKGSFLWAIDETRTAMGARLLRAWIAAPSRDRAEIAARQEAIAALLAEPLLCSELQSRLKDIRDVVRLSARTRLGSVTPRELGAVRASLLALPSVQALLRELVGRRIDDPAVRLLDLGEDLLDDLAEDLASTLVDDPPSITREGGMIREGADRELDEQRRLRDGGREALAAIETRERTETGINNLKVQHNRVFGYFIEVPRGQVGRVPRSYVRKQTLANAERYVTEELAGHEARVLGAHDQALEREQQLFSELRGRISRQAERLLAMGERLATLDVLAGLATVAQQHGYTRPELVDEPVIEIDQGRHPVVERMLEGGRFVPNDVQLHAARAGAGRLWVITGPNMGGKSTVMRQTALIAILAHMGSYVPAERARLGLCDRVFTRVGAADDLGRGDSTFMVEMRETAQILANATASSIVLLDEIGRGTATFDGLALAWAITEFLHDQVRCRTLFATHYHELCALEAMLPGIRNVHVAVHERRGGIVFLHQIQPGSAGRSYGVQVGRLAGLPAGVLRRATRILERLEGGQLGARPQLDLFRGDGGVGQEAVPRAPTQVQDLIETLEGIDPDALSPRQAHDLLRSLRERVARS